jgi:heterodisulfide reductase subunit A
MGFKVYIVERTSSIGGRMAQLDKTFPTLDCSMCILSPRMVDVTRDENIQLLTRSEVIGLEGEPGDFKVRLRRKPRYVDEERCIGCGSCADACLLKGKIPNEFDLGLGKRSAIYIQFPQAVPSKYAIDPKSCIFIRKGKCREYPACKDACEADAIDFEQKEEEIELDVGAIIIATGHDPIDIKRSEFGYDLDGVITALEFERLTNASGPTGGEISGICRKHPDKIAFLGCVGSRDCRKKEYCSSVCCTYATKEAIIAKEHGVEECHIFYMDMRTYGKGFEEFRKRAEDEYRVVYHESRVAEVQQGNGDIVIVYEDVSSGEISEERYDLIVLCNGLRPSDRTVELADALGVEVDDDGFIKTRYTSPIETTRDGIFVCGTAESPKDIPDSVVQALGATAKAGKLLQAEKVVSMPPPQKEMGEDVRVGLFVCRCGTNISSTVDVKSLVEYAEMDPNVVYAEENIYTCSKDTQDAIKNVIEEFDLNRVVVAACTPRTHEPLFRNTCMEAGLNPYLFELANIREHCAWVHDDKEGATEKAKDIVRSAIERAVLLTPLEDISTPIEPKALVIGGGVSGMTAAIDIAECGFKVHLIEREKELGGLTRDLHSLIDGESPKKLIYELIKDVESNNNIILHKNAKLKELSGFIGNFEAVIDDGERLKIGCIILATGAKELSVGRFCEANDGRFPEGKSDSPSVNRQISDGYDEPEIITMLDLEKKLSDGFLPPESVTFLLCVGCREEKRPYCSRYCCNAAIKNALRLKDLNPKARIRVLHHDIRTYGEYERYYVRAMEEGILFIRFDEWPEISIGEKIGIKVKDLYSSSKIEEETDLLVLVMPLIPQDDAEEISKMLKTSLDGNGFFLEAHTKLRPIDVATDGIFFCGTCHSPKMVNECISQASGAAARACTILSKERVETEAITSFVDEKLCSGCGICVANCAYNAIRKDEKGIARVTEALCKGCGVCGASCPEMAITMRHYTNEQLIAQAAA